VNMTPGGGAFAITSNINNSKGYSASSPSKSSTAGGSKQTLVRENSPSVPKLALPLPNKATCAWTLCLDWVPLDDSAVRHVRTVVES